MKRFYCPECGKQGYCAYLYFIVFLVIGATIGICLGGCKDNTEAIEISDPVDITIELSEPNDYDELVVVVQELQKMVSKLIDIGNVQMDCLGNLSDIDSSILERIEKLEEQQITSTWAETDITISSDDISKIPICIIEDE